MVYGLAPAVPLRDDTKRSFPFRQLPSAFPVDSLRVRWVPLVRSFRRLGVFAMGTVPVCTAFPCSDYYAPSATPCRHRDFVQGLPLPTIHLPWHPARSFPCSAWQTQMERGRWRVSLLAPSALCGSPVFAQRVEQVDRCDRGHPISWARLVLTRSARICFEARLADLIDKGGQGQRSS